MSRKPHCRPWRSQLRTIGSNSPHFVAGGNFAWVNTLGVYVSNAPATAKDFSAYTTLTFRVTRKYASPSNPAGPIQNFHRLRHRKGKSRSIEASSFTEIPSPYRRGDDDLVKSVMKSVRIPLASDTIAIAIAIAGAQDVGVRPLVKGCQ